MSENDSFLQEALPLWIAATRDVRVSTGLSREEALHQARALRRLLRKHPIHAGEIDEDSKSVLRALCLLLEEDPPLDLSAAVEEAWRIFAFIDSVQWPDDVFDEKSELLRRCAEIGLRAVGGSSPSESRGSESEGDVVIKGQNCEVPDRVPKRWKEIESAFVSSLDVIHIALVGEYQIEEGKATELEKDLYVWFVRFCMRPGNQTPEESRESLLVACCQFAREYQRYLVGTGVRETSEKVQRLLDREPADVAKDFSQSLELRTTGIILMPKTGKLLRFPAQSSRGGFTPGEAAECASRYLGLPPNVRDTERSSTLSDPDILVAVLGLLRERREAEPQLVFDEASATYSWLREAGASIGLFDEKDYFLAESAFLAGTSSRALGKRDDAARWLNRAEAGFRHTLNPTPGMASVSYARAALIFEMGGYEEVLDVMPSVRLSFERLGMTQDVAKSLLLESMALKNLGRAEEALGLLNPVRSWNQATLGASLKGRIVSEIGDLLQLRDDLEGAFFAYQEALGLLGACATSPARADLKMFVGEAHRVRGRNDVAIEAFRSATEDYRQLGMEARVAYARLFTAETLLRVNRAREAEWEILAAIPTINEQKMGPQGIAAVALLEESVRRRKTDPEALRQLREQLQSKS